MSQLLTTLATRIFIIIQAGISCTDGSFHAPAILEYPMVTVRDTCTIDFAVITVVAQPEYIEIAHVYIGVMAVQAEKATVETFAKPVTEFGLYQPVLDLSVFGEFPGVVVARYVKSKFFRQSHFKSQVRSTGSPVEGIGFDGKLGQISFCSLLLCMYACGKHKQEACC